MILYLFKPFGGDNYLCLSKPEEIQKFFDNLTPGDEFMLRVLELSDQEYEGLDDFGGFEGNAAPAEETPAPAAGEEGSPEEEATEPAPKEAAEDNTAQE